MIKRLFLFSFVLFFLALFSKSQALVSSDLFRNLYIGIENPISIMTEDGSDDQVAIQVNEGRLKKTGPHKYTWTICSSENKYVLLKVYKRSSLVDSSWFKLIPIADPTIIITTQDHEIIFKGTHGVRSELENFAVSGISTNIQTFNIRIVKKNGDTTLIENHGSFYEKIALEAFNALKIGDKVILSDFVVTVGCDANTRKLKTVFIQVYSGKEYEPRF